MIITFTVQGEPKPQPRPRAFARNMGGGKFAARVYDAGTAEHWKSCVALAAKPHLPPTPLEEPLFVQVDFRMPRPKGHFNSKGELRPAAPRYPAGRNDIDNMLKAIFDALTQIGMWRDDGQIVSVQSSKSYAIGSPGAKIQIVTLR